MGDRYDELPDPDGAPPDTYEVIAEEEAVQTGYDEIQAAEAPQDAYEMLREGDYDYRMETVAAAPAVEYDPALAQQAAAYEMAEMNAAYVHEDNRDDPRNRWVKAGEQRDETYYADENERRAYEIRSDCGQLQRYDGQVFDTTGAEPGPYVGSQAGREGYVIDPQGQMYSSDMALQQSLRPDDERFHHSSYLAGGDVAAAGEIQVRDGVAELLTDRSGHHTPRIQQTRQAIDNLEMRGQTVEAIGVELGDKGPGYEGTVHAGAVEVQAYDRTSPDLLAAQAKARASGAAEPTAEQLLRQRHAQKDEVGREIASETSQWRASLDSEAILREAELRGRDLTRDDVQDELLARMTQTRNDLDASAAQRARDVPLEQADIDAEKKRRADAELHAEWVRNSPQRETENLAHGLDADGYEPNPVIPKGE